MRAATPESRQQSHAVSTSMEMRVRVLDEDDRHPLVLEHTKDTTRELQSAWRNASNGPRSWTQTFESEAGRALNELLERARPVRRCTHVSLTCSRTRHAARGMHARKQMSLPNGPKATHVGTPVIQRRCDLRCARHAACWMLGSTCVVPRVPQDASNLLPCAKDKGEEVL